MSSVCAYLFWGFKIHHSRENIIFPPFLEEECEYSIYEKFNSRILEKEPKRNIEIERKEIYLPWDQKIHKEYWENWRRYWNAIDNARFGCIIQCAGYDDNDDKTYYLIIKESKKAACSEYDAAEDVVFDLLPDINGWQKRLNNFCEYLNVPKQCGQWILTLHR